MQSETFARTSEQIEPELMNKPKSKFGEMMKRFWERIKAAGKALLTPRDKEQFLSYPDPKAVYVLAVSPQPGEHWRSCVLPCPVPATTRV
jgi:hypothetical protein